jgi:pimeloyl-ACP methyl ester carboxylesterase
MTLADEAALALPLLECGGVHLFGHSYGAAVALQSAALRPQRVRSLTVYEPVWFRLLIDRGLGDEVIALSASIRDRLGRNDPHEAAVNERIERFVRASAAAGYRNKSPRCAIRISAAAAD